MGLESDCDATFGGRTSRGKARLEEKELLFRGDFRLRIPLSEIGGVQERGGRLSLEWPGGRASLDLGPQAPRWADKIRNPRGLMDKLGLKPGQTVSVIALADGDVCSQIRQRVPDASFGRLRKDSDLIVLGLEDAAGLPRLARAVASLRPDGAIWVVWPKGRRSFREDDIRAFGPQAGLVDVKVVSVSDALSGLKMMIPVARRPRGLTPRRSRT
jgi:hypothetical protein